MIFAMIFVGVFCVVEGKGFWHLIMTTVGWSILGSVAAILIR